MEATKEHDAIYQYINSIGFSKPELTATIASMLYRLGNGDVENAKRYIEYMRKEYNKTPHEVMNHVR